MQEQPKARRVTAHLRSGSAIESEIMTFDYSLPAEMYLAKRGGGERQGRQHRRFPTAAEAIRFAVEDFTPVGTLNAWMRSETSASTAAASNICMKAAVTLAPPNALKFSHHRSDLGRHCNYSSRSPRRASMICLASEMMSSLGLFSRLVGLSCSGAVAPCE